MMVLAMFVRIWFLPASPSARSLPTKLTMLGFRRCELSFRITSMPPFLACAMTQDCAPSDTPTTAMDIFAR